MMFARKTIAAGFAALGLLLLNASVPEAYAQKTIKLHHLNKDDPFDNATGAMAAVFKNLVESGTNGELKVQTFPNGQLGQDATVVQQVQSGVIQSGIFSEGGFASVYPMIGVLDVPFAFPNISVTYKVFDGPFGKRLAADIEKKTGLHVLGFGDSGGFYEFTNSKRQIKTLADIKGLKIRVQPVETQKRLLEALGANPVTIAWSEVYTSLQTGVADGQMNPIPIIAFAKFDEVQKYLTLSDHLFTPYVWAMNKQFYESLSPQERNVVDYAARSAIVAGRGISRIIEASDRGVPALSKKMAVYALPPAEKAKFKAAAAPAVEKYIVEKFGQDGKSMLKAYLEAIAQASKD